MRFPLDEQIVGGYDYGVKTSYNDFHLGVDWRARYVPLYAPKNGTIIWTGYGLQGGWTIWFKSDGENVIIRWLHLKLWSILVKKGQKVKEGQRLATTGNTGKSDLPHTHEDIWKNGKVTLKAEDTINPHDYYKEAKEESLIKGDDMVVFNYNLRGNPTLYLQVGQLSLIPIGMSYEDFKRSFPNAKEEKLSDEQFEIFEVIPGAKVLND